MGCQLDLACIGGIESRAVNELYRIKVYGVLNLFDKIFEFMFYEFQSDLNLVCLNVIEF